MALREYQQEIDADTLYEIKKKGGVSGDGQQLKPNIEVIGATADIYVSNEEPDSAPTGMYIIANGEALEGGAYFEYIPNYLYVDGSPTTIILSGISAVEVV